MTDFEIYEADASDLPDFRSLSSMLFESDSRFDPHFNKRWAFTEAAEKYFDETLRNGVCFLARNDGHAIGLLDATVQKEDATSTVLRSVIGQLYVVPAWRRKGVARQLFHGYVPWCHKRQVQEITVGVFQNNDEAHQFYRSVGLNPWIIKLNGSVADMARSYSSRGPGAGEGDR
jgi:GNAT superfamily N-acetyltransferase